LTFKDSGGHLPHTDIERHEQAHFQKYARISLVELLVAGLATRTQTFLRQRCRAVHPQTAQRFDAHSAAAMPVRHNAHLDTFPSLLSFFMVLRLLKFHRAFGSRAFAGDGPLSCG
jgi:hypothetical protein